MVDSVCETRTGIASHARQRAQVLNPTEYGERDQILVPHPARDAMIAPWSGAGLVQRPDGQWAPGRFRCEIS